MRQGETTATALLDQTLARIEAAAGLRAVVHVQTDAARARASSPLDGPFAGVPLLAKDLLPYPGLRAAMGCALFAGHVPEHPLPYTEALDRAGLLCIGKTATSELGLLGSTETRLEGVTRNPWGAEWSAGGSSGGAAAAVAAGLVPMAHASDGGGSIRLPAALHGLFGFKPSGGAMLSATPMENDFSALVAEHAITQTVRDSATLFFATQQHPTEHVRSAEGLKRLRIGVYTTDAFGQPASAEALAAVETTAALCAELGHHVEHVEAPRIDGQAISDSFFTLAGGFLAGLDQMMTPMLGRPLGPMDVEPFTWALLQRFRSLGPDAYPRALATQQAQGAAMRSFLSHVDVALCPTVGGERPALGHLAPHLPLDVLLARTQRLAGFTAIHNSAGAPAMSVPLCSSSDGLPVGVQFAASPGDDDTLLRLAFELEQASPWIDRLPIG